MKKRVATILLMILIINIFSVLNITSFAEEDASEITVDVERILVKCDEYNCECKKYGVVKAYRDNEKLWEYTTQIVNITELETISDVNKNGVTAYIVVGGILYALDIWSGQVKWTVNNVGAGNSFAFDNYGSVYISGYYGPNVVVIDKNGTVLYRDDNQDYGWVSSLKIDGDILIIPYEYDMSGASGVKTVDISRFYLNNEDETSLSYDAAVAYKKVIDEAVEKYGKFNPSSYTGVGLIRLIDFDNDGKDELLLGYAIRRDGISSYCEVYGYNNDVYKLCAVDCSCYTDGYADLSIKSKDGKRYIVTSKYGPFSSTFYMGTVDNNVWKSDMIYNGPENEGDYMGRYISRYNDRVLTEQEYKDMVGELCADDVKILTYNVMAAETGLSKIEEIISSQKKISVILDGKEISFDQPPVMRNDRVLVPVRAVFEALGATVEWNEKTQTVTSTKGSTTITMKIGEYSLNKNGVVIGFDVPSQIINNRTLVPVRAVAESFGCIVDWDESNQQVKVISKEQQVIETAKALHYVYEQSGGVRSIAEYGQVDTLLYQTMGDIVKGKAINEFTLDMVNASAKVTIAVATATKGKYPQIDNIGDGIAGILSSKEIADAADGVLKDAVKKRVFEELSASVADIESLILNLGRSAYDDNSMLINEMIMLHPKIGRDDLSYDDAKAYIIMHDTLAMNRETMKMAIAVSSKDLPNALESLYASAVEAVKATADYFFDIGVSYLSDSASFELFAEVLKAYVEYTCGREEDFYTCMRQLNNPAINEWINEVEKYNNNLAKKIGVE